MAEHWKRFRTTRLRRRKAEDGPLPVWRRLLVLVRRYEKRIAVVVVVLLAAIWGYRLVSSYRHIPDNPVASTKDAISTLATTIRIFRASAMRVPSTEEGLGALVSRPSGMPPEGWQGPYLEKIPTDPWGRPFSYMEKDGAFLIRSFGADGLEKTDDDIVGMYPAGQ
jgi:general secretion pathway protein G